MKACKITEDNVDMLANRFNVLPDDKTDMLPIGYYLVTDFGNDEKFDVLTYTNLHAFFTQIGPALKNGFFEVMTQE